jgi:hypothetical protein
MEATALHRADYILDPQATVLSSKFECAMGGIDPHLLSGSGEIFIGTEARYVAFGRKREHAAHAVGDF